MERNSFQIRLDSLLLRGYLRACQMITAYFLFLALFRTFWFHHRLKVPLLFEGWGFFVAFSAFAFIASRVRPEKRSVEWLGVGMVACGALNALALHLILADNLQTTNFMVVTVATGLAFRSTLPFVLSELLIQIGRAHV